VEDILVVPLHEDSSNGIVGGVNLNFELLLLIWLNEDWLLTDQLLQLLKRRFLGVTKAPFNVLLQKGIEWLCYVREAPDKSPVEITEPKEFAYIFNCLGFLPFFYTCDFDQVHGDSTIF
jgi:hypothetical protein